MLRMLLGLACVVGIGAGCTSTAKYQVMQKGTYKVGVPAASQNPTILQNVSSTAPGGKAAIIVVYFGADKAPILEAKGDSTALIAATAVVGRKAFDVAVKLSRAAAGP